MKEIRIIELELFNYCNRVCSWCPNKDLKKRQKQFKKLKDSTFKRFIKDLKKIDYKGYITFSRYNEPFSNFKILLSKARYIKKHLKDVKLVTNTNGDFVSYKKLFKASKYFSEITIMNYDKKSFVLDKKIEKEETYFEINGCKIAIFSEFDICDRGGILKDVSDIKRTDRCLEPLRFLAIDYTGDVMPCCNLRHEFHKNYILGNINDKSILDIFASKKREKIINQIPNIKPCFYCTKKPGRHTRDVPGINK